MKSISVTQRDICLNYTPEPIDALIFIVDPKEDGAAFYQQLALWEDNKLLMLRFHDVDLISDPEQQKLVDDGVISPMTEADAYAVFDFLDAAKGLGVTRLIISYVDCTMTGLALATAIYSKRVMLNTAPVNRYVYQLMTSVQLKR